jgi:hypothetical protein
MHAGVEAAAEGREVLSEEYLLMIIREQGRQLAELATAVSVQGQALMTLAGMVGRLGERVLQLEAVRAVEQMQESRTIN